MPLSSPPLIHPVDFAAGRLELIDGQPLQIPWHDVEHLRDG